MFVDLLLVFQVELVITSCLQKRRLFVICRESYYHWLPYTPNIGMIMDFQWVLVPLLGDRKIWVWVNTYRYIFSGMNIHLPAILGFTRYPIPISGDVFSIPADMRGVQHPCPSQVDTYHAAASQTPGGSGHGAARWTTMTTGRF